jgi:hypothetical protein
MERLERKSSANREEPDKAGSPSILRTAIISIAAAFLLAGGTVNLVSYHPADEGSSLLAPLGIAAGWKEQSIFSAGSAKLSVARVRPFCIFPPGESWRLQLTIFSSTFQIG